MSIYLQYFLCASVTQHPASTLTTLTNTEGSGRNVFLKFCTQEAIPTSLLHNYRYAKLYIYTRRLTVVFSVLCNVKKF